MNTANNSTGAGQTSPCHHCHAIGLILNVFPCLKLRAPIEAFGLLRSNALQFWKALHFKTPKESLVTGCSGPSARVRYVSPNRR